MVDHFFNLTNSDVLNFIVTTCKKCVHSLDMVSKIICYLSGTVKEVESVYYHKLQENEELTPNGDARLYNYSEMYCQNRYII